MFLGFDPHNAVSDCSFRLIESWSEFHDSISGEING